jgi:hypothetical protein
MAPRRHPAAVGKTNSTRDDGSGVYTHSNERALRFITPDPRYDEAGNEKERPVEMADKISKASDGTSNDYVQPLWPGRGLSAEMRFGGGAMTRPINKPGLKRY